MHTQAGQKLQILTNMKTGNGGTSHPVSNPSPFRIFGSVPLSLVGLFSIMYACFHFHFCFVTSMKKTWQEPVQLHKLYGFDIGTMLL